ncbi:MAG: hypothetical protein RL226_780 [Bacteroidota bacterium]|jgi:hypothetical protein
MKVNCTSHIPLPQQYWLHYPVEADDHATFELYSPQGQLLQSFKPNKLDAGKYIVSQRKNHPRIAP